MSSKIQVFFDFLIKLHCKKKFDFMLNDADIRILFEYLGHSKDNILATNKKIKVSRENKKWKQELLMAVFLKNEGTKSKSLLASFFSISLHFIQDKIYSLLLYFQKNDLNNSFLDFLFSLDTLIFLLVAGKLPFECLRYSKKYLISALLRIS